MTDLKNKQCQSCVHTEQSHTYKGTGCFYCFCDAFTDFEPLALSGEEREVLSILVAQRLEVLGAIATRQTRPTMQKHALDQIATLRGVIEKLGL